MLQTVIALERDGIDVRVLTLNFEVPNKEFDLRAAVMAAATEYCKTEEGRRTYDYNCSNFNWADFASEVPNEFCEKFGFSLVQQDVADLVVDWDEQLVDESRVKQGAWKFQHWGGNGYLAVDVLHNSCDFVLYDSNYVEIECGQVGVSNFGLEAIRDELMLSFGYDSAVVKFEPVDFNEVTDRANAVASGKEFVAYFHDDPHVQVFRDPDTGIAWAEDHHTGLGVSVHANIDETGSVDGMKARGWWGREDRAVKSHGWIYNIDTLVYDETNELERFVAKECKCAACKERNLSLDQQVQVCEGRQKEQVDLSEQRWAADKDGHWSAVERD